MWFALSWLLLLLLLLLLLRELAIRRILRLLCRAPFLLLLLRLLLLVEFIEFVVLLGRGRQPVPRHWLPVVVVVLLDLRIIKADNRPRVVRFSDPWHRFPRSATPVDDKAT